MCEGHNVSQGLVNQLQVEVADVSNILLPPNSCSIAESVSRPLYQRLTVNNGLYSKHSFARGYQGEILQCSPRTSLCKRTRHDANVKHLTSGSLRMMLDANHDIRKLDNDAARKASNADIAAAIYSSIHRLSDEDREYLSQNHHYACGIRPVLTPISNDMQRNKIHHYIHLGINSISLAKLGELGLDMITVASLHEQGWTQLLTLLSVPSFSSNISGYLPKASK